MTCLQSVTEMGDDLSSIGSEELERLPAEAQDVASLTSSLDEMLSLSDVGSARFAAFSISSASSDEWMGAALHHAASQKAEADLNEELRAEHWSKKAMAQE